MKFIVYGKIQLQSLAKTNKIKEQIKAGASEAVDGQWPKYTGPISLIIKEYRSIPESWPHRRQSAAINGAIRPITSPSLRRLVSLCEDVLHNYIFRDNSQVVSYDGSGKFYAAIPRLEVEITRL